jgi:hypothetical protein
LSLGQGEIFLLISANESFFVLFPRQFEKGEFLLSIKNQIDLKLNISADMTRVIDQCEVKLSVSEKIEFGALHLYQLSSSLSKVRVNEIEAIL